VEGARRFKVDIARWPRIQAVDASCAQLEAFRKAAPDVQPDAATALGVLGSANHAQAAKLS
jgi:hypothetical protein